MTRTDFLRGMVAIRTALLVMRAMDTDEPMVVRYVNAVLVVRDGEIATDALNYPLHAVWPFLGLGARDMLVRAQVALDEVPP